MGTPLGTRLARAKVPTADVAPRIPLSERTNVKGTSKSANANWNHATVKKIAEGVSAPIAPRLAKRRKVSWAKEPCRSATAKATANPAPLAAPQIAQRTAHVPTERPIRMGMPNLQRQDTIYAQSDSREQPQH